MHPLSPPVKYSSPPMFLFKMVLTLWYAFCLGVLFAFCLQQTPVTCYSKDVLDIGIMGWYSPILLQVDGGTIQNKLCQYWWRMLLEDLTGWLDFCYPIQKFWKESLVNFS